MHESPEIVVWTPLDHLAARVYALTAAAQRTEQAITAAPSTELAYALAAMAIDQWVVVLRSRAALRES